MPLDNRRVNGPESSISYHYNSASILKTNEEKLDELYSKCFGLRKDGRKSNIAREICILKHNLKIWFL